MISPVAGGVVTQAFGHNGHRGVDIAAAPGTPVTALWDATVVRADFDTNVPSFGWHVRAQAGAYTHIYGHMQPGSLAVKVGQRIVLGTVLGREGHSGTAFGDHVHVEIRKDGVVIDPTPFLNGEKIPGVNTGAPLGVNAPASGNPIEQAGNVIAGAAGGALSGLDAVGAFFAALGQRSTWIRVAQVVGGAALVTAGVVIVGKGVVQDVAVSAMPGGAVLKAATGS